MSIIKLYVDLGHDNIEKLEITSSDSTDDFSTVNRVEVVLDNGTSIDSNVNPDMFSWSVGSTNNVLNINFKLGAVTGVGEGCYVADLVLYDPSHTKGQVIVRIHDRQLAFIFQ